MSTFHPLPNIFLFLSLTCGCLTHRPLSSYSYVLSRRASGGASCSAGGGGAAGAAARSPAASPAAPK